MSWEHENPQNGCSADGVSNCVSEKRRADMQRMKIIMRAVDEVMLPTDKNITPADESSEIDRQAQLIADVAAHYALAGIKKQFMKDAQKKETPMASTEMIPCRVVRAEHLGTTLASVP